jgi:hypothetical protein
LIEVGGLHARNHKQNCMRAVELICNAMKIVDEKESKGTHVSGTEQRCCAHCVSLYFLCWKTQPPYKNLPKPGRMLNDHDLLKTAERVVKLQSHLQTAWEMLEYGVEETDMKRSSTCFETAVKYSTDAKDKEELDLKASALKAELASKQRKKNFFKTAAKYRVDQRNTRRKAELQREMLQVEQVHLKRGINEILFYLESLGAIVFSCHLSVHSKISAGP